MVRQDQPADGVRHRLDEGLGAGVQQPGHVQFLGRGGHALEHGEGVDDPQRDRPARGLLRREAGGAEGCL